MTAYRYVQSESGTYYEAAADLTVMPCFCVSRFGDNDRCPTHGASKLKGDVDRPKPSMTGKAE